jgi:hypothetical protein
MTNEAAEAELARALQSIAKVVRIRSSKHPQAHLLRQTGAILDLGLQIPLSQGNGWLSPSSRRLSEMIDAGIQSQLNHHSLFRSGRVYCLRCRSPNCEHSQPGSNREVFTGYRPNGLPKYLDFGQSLLEKKDPRVDRLYAKRPDLVTELTEGASLLSKLLPAYREPENNYRLHGQVAAGWFAFPTREGWSDSLALSFQLVSSQADEQKRHYSLNVIGTGPRGEALENLFDLTGEIPWSGAAKWGQGVLRQIENRKSPTSPASIKSLDKRLVGLLNGLARRLERHRRARDRRTVHGQKRHRESSRPTWKAADDVSQARKDSFLYDTRRKTWIVLGARGRTHVFTDGGKLVTSITYSGQAIERRRESGAWRQATSQEIDNLKKSMGSET